MSHSEKVNISGIKTQEGLEYFRRLEKQNEWLDNQHIDACISIMCKWAHEHYPQLYKQKICILDTYFYLILLGLSHEMKPPSSNKTFKLTQVVLLEHLLEYAKGGSPPWGLQWHEVDLILVSCHFDDHWVVVHIYLLKWSMMLVDSSYSQRDVIKSNLCD
ncbi:PREDICTED: uncharacterized protein LOC108663881 [Theobroma cacao]|uniref:Uncharacterized protein LOC108663881 n=1 Tax=Theobroma cacao TaxID=3641 RepID=A0AB32X369_THECC|nr:PREDICTED: uncharacterized protein LOC108663881 [Theobroma cacao]